MDRLAQAVISKQSCLERRAMSSGSKAMCPGRKLTIQRG